jgi:DegV family protein with EDD domain
MSVRIVTDSNCDLPQEVVDRYGIVVVPFYINIGTRSYLDGVDMSHAEFYEGLPNFPSHPTTSVPGPGTLVDLYGKLAAEGAAQILSIHVGASLSAMVNSARLAAEESNPLPVTVFDSGNLTLGTGLQVVAAARAAAQGQSLPEILTLLEEMTRRTHCLAALDTLEYLRRSGRLSRFQWGMGAALRIKPVLRMNAGQVEMERVRTRNRSIDRVLALVEALGPLEDLVLVHTHAPEQAQALKERARHLFPESASSLSAEVTPVIGSHIGPGAVGFVAVQAAPVQASPTRAGRGGDPRGDGSGKG